MDNYELDYDSTTRRYAEESNFAHPWFDDFELIYRNLSRGKNHGIIREFYIKESGRVINKTSKHQYLDQSITIIVDGVSIVRLSRKVKKPKELKQLRTLTTALEQNRASIFQSIVDTMIMGGVLNVLETNPK